MVLLPLKEKELFVSFLESNSNRASEYTIHHEFSEHSARESAKDVHAISEYIEKVGNTLTESFIEKPFQNLVTGESNDVMYHHNISCIVKGTSLFENFRKDRLQTRDVLLFDRLKRCGPSKTVTHKVDHKVYDIEKETLLAMRYVEYAYCRDFPLKELLATEITSKPFFLVDKEGRLKKPEKHLLGKELLKYMKEDLKSYPPISDCVVIDFMAFVYTLTSNSLQSEGKDVTFGHAANILLQKFLKMGANTNSIHIAFDIYNESSIKSDEHTRRTGKKSAVIIPLQVSFKNSLLI